MAESTTNVFFASTFTVTIILAFLLWAILKRYGKDSHPGPVKLIYVVLMSMIFVFLVIIVFYPPARNFLFAAQSLTVRIRLLFLSAFEPPADLYQVVNASWRIPFSWIFLRTYDILLILAAGLEWLFLVRRARKSDELSPLRTDYYWLLILLPAFAFQNAAAVLSDITGSVGEINNLQIRLIPLTTFIAAPLAASLIVRFVQKDRTSTRISRLVFSGSIICVLVSLLLALVKGASEPLLSNTWLFYSHDELAGIRWLDEYLPSNNVDHGRHVGLVWAGPDFRLKLLWQNVYWGPNLNVIPITTDQSLLTYAFISPAVRILTERYHQALPDLRPADIIYDNGSVQIYYWLPTER